MATLANMVFEYSVSLLEFCTAGKFKDLFVNNATRDILRDFGSMRASSSSLRDLKNEPDEDIEVRETGIDSNVIPEKREDGPRSSASQYISEIFDVQNADSPLDKSIDPSAMESFFDGLCDGGHSSG